MENCFIAKFKGVVDDNTLPRISDYENSVDLGLPSGLRWSRYNVDLSKADKFADSEYQYECSYFSWGNVDGHRPVGTSFNDIIWNEETYSQTEGATLNNNIPSSMDAAVVNISPLWIIPSKEDFVELMDNTIVVDANGNEITSGSNLITIDNVKGLRLKSKINGNIIFFPCSGHGNGEVVTGRGSFGLYLASSYYSGADCYSFMPNNTTYAYTTNSRHFGYALRPVIKLED